MNGDKINQLRIAGESFIHNCNMEDTSVGLVTFGLEPEEIRRPLSNDSTLLLSEILSLVADGGTPMGEAMKYTLENIPITRGVLVSDGRPTDNPQCWKEVAHMYAEATIPIDCVHVGDSENGVDVMKSIAEITGGIYMKFKDVGNFASAFKFLTPGSRALLTSGSVDAQALGATEIK